MVGDRESDAVRNAMENVTESVSRDGYNQPLVMALIKALDEKVGLLINAQKEGVKTAMDAAEKAVAKAEVASDKRFEGLNELRSMAADWRNEFARQTTVDLQIKGIESRLYALDVTLREKGAHSSGVKDLFAYLVAFSGLLIAALTVYVQHGTFR
jgi:hypothetical protein